MQINFFEEYPTQENMAKLDLIDWPATILVTAPSLEAFESIRAIYTKKYPNITFGWWPTIPDSYWISGLSNPTDLDNLFAEITSRKQEHPFPILIDLEPPRNKYLYIKNIFNISKNKKKISNFFNDAPNYNIKIYTAEYPTPNNFVLGLWRFLGISPAFSFEHTKLIMYYSSIGIKSLGKNIWSKVNHFEKQFALSNLGRIGFGLGTIAIGVSRNQTLLSPKDLSKDLEWAKEAGVQEIFIFRLGGLDESYISAIKKSII